MRGYAARVAGGFRPPPAGRIPPLVWALVQECWHQEPQLRPSMHQVVAALQGIILGGRQQQQLQLQQQKQQRAQQQHAQQKAVCRRWWELCRG
jgi:hypothetical protein